MNHIPILKLIFVLRIDFCDHRRKFRKVWISMRLVVRSEYIHEQLNSNVVSVVLSLF